MEQIVTMTAEDVLKAYTEKGLSTKRLNRAQATNTQMPKAGTFSKLGFATFKNPKTEVETPYPVLYVIDAKGKEIGTIAVGTVLQQISSGKARQVKRVDSEYVGKWFHAGRPLSSIPGLTETEQVAGLIGASFKTIEKRDERVGKLEFKDEKVVMFETEAEAISATELKDCYQIILA